MAYYRGDYYRGDYYRGDLLGGLKKLGKAALGAVTGFAAGGPVGAIAGGLAGLKGPKGTQLATTPTFAGSSTMGLVPIGAIAKNLPAILKTGGKVATAVGVGTTIAQFLPRFGGGNGKRRTMNHLNPRALARSTRRIEGFIKKARKIASPLGYTVQRRASSRCAPKRKCR